MTARTLPTVVAILPLLGAGPSFGPLEPCGVDPSSVVPLAVDEGSVVVSIDLPSTGSADEPGAVAIESLAPGKDAPTISVRFAFGPASAPSTRWSWLPGASARLGPGSGPSIALIPGDGPTWIVLFSRIGPTGARPVAVLVEPDEKARRLDLEEIVLDGADHVFGPRALRTASGSAHLVWGESRGATDTIRSIPHPPDGAQAATHVSGSLGDTFGAVAGTQGLVLAWLEQDPATLEGWTLAAAIHDGQTVSGPSVLSTHAAHARILDLVAGPEGIRVHLLERDPLRWLPVTVTASSSLTSPQTVAASGPKLPPATSLSGAAVEDGLALAWLGTHRSMSGLWARTGGPTFSISPAATGGVIDICPSSGGLSAGWTEGSRLLILDLELEDADTDTIPDSADLCPDLPEPVNSLLDHDGCPDPPRAVGSPLEATTVWFPRSATTCDLPDIPRVDESAAGLLPAEEASGILCSATHPKHGALLAGAGGLLVRLDSPDAEPRAVKPPAGVKKDTAVGIVLAKEGIFVAWRKAGAFYLKSWKSKWTKIHHLDPEDPAAGGARALVRSSSGDIYLVSLRGALYHLGQAGWEREETGLEGAWILDATTDPATGAAVAVGISGSPVLYSPHAVDQRVTVPAKHFVKSGKKAKKSVGKVLKKVLAGITSGKLLVRLEGYTDSKGSEKLNLTMSLRRAQALKSWLVARGADPTHIQVIGFGEAHPIAQPTSESNRRVEVVLLEP